MSAGHPGLYRKKILPDFPEKTLFLSKGEQQGAVIANGYDMLVYQAEASWEIWSRIR